MKKNKKLPVNSTDAFVRLAFSAAALLAAVILLLTVIFDPFYHYHKPWFSLKPVLTDKEYQVVGTLRHFDYDAVLVGSSVVENNDNSWFDALFGCRTVKAVRSYGGIADLCWYADEAFLSREKKGAEIKKVFFNLDPTALIADASTTFEASGCPMYLYDRNPFNDVSYLLNKTVLFEKIPYMLAQNRSGYNPDLSYNWAEGKDFSRDGVLSHYFREKEPHEMMEPDAFDENVRANAALLSKLISEHPQTQFYFFLPPYSVIWWDSAVRSGERDAFLYAQERVLSEILSFDNVEVYDFQTDEEIISELDNYMDPIHFTPQINAYMAQTIAGESSGSAEPAHRVPAQDVKSLMEKTADLSDGWIDRYIGSLDSRGLINYYPDGE